MGTPVSERGLICAPFGRDAVVAAELLHEAAIAAEPVPSMAALVERIAAGAGFAVITEEALRDADLQALAKVIADQPVWSDFPFVLITEPGAGVEHNPQAERLQKVLGNVSFLERPFRPTTLISLSRAALRARRRQYEARSRLETIRLGQQQYRVALAAGDLGSWSLDVSSGTLATSRRCRAHYGRAADDAFDYPTLIASIHPDDRDYVTAQIAAARNGEADYDVEYRCIWPDGSVHWVMVRGQLDSTGLPGS